MNIYKLKVISAIITINSLISLRALAQVKIHTVSSILNNPVEGEVVTLQGKIISQQIGQSDYTFTDGTNEITLELEKSDFPYDPNQTVQVMGIVDFESQHPDEAAKDPSPEDIQIDVTQLQVVTSSK